MFKEFYTLREYAPITEMVLEKTPELPIDGFYLRMNDDGVLRAQYQNSRAKDYLKRTIRQLTKRGEFPVCYLKDYPSFPFRGVVEGFYGKPYTHEQRLELFTYLKEVRMNSYLYAPKDDLYHREKWRLPYSPEADERIKELSDQAKRNRIDFYYGISPGKDFNYADEADYKILIEKLKKIRSLGVQRFALLMDDIEPKLSEEEQKLFDSPAHAHAHLANFVLKELEPKPPFLFCPTDYMQNYDTPYRADIRKYLDGQVSVFWTGYNTVAEAITDEDGKVLIENFGRHPVLWDNYPVNDFEPKRRVYLGAVRNRSRYLYKTHSGYLVNLSELYESSKIPLTTMSHFAWDTEGYLPKEALREAVATYFKGCVHDGSIFVKLNESNVMRHKNVVKKAIAKEDFAALDKHYEKVKKALLNLQKKAKPEFVEEIKDLFTFALTECEAYFAFRRGADKEEMQSYSRIMNACKYATADLSVLQYINEKYALEEPFKIDERRENYRRW